MKNIFFVFAIIASIQSNAQITKANLQASGLTCSMCSNSINKALKTLSFVEKVEPNIKTSSFAITFKPNSNVDIDGLKKKVEDAGFFVNALTVTASFDNVNISNDVHAKAFDNWFHFINVQPQKLNGEVQFKVLDKGFVSSKVHKANSKYSTLNCYKTGIAAVCCSQAGAKEKDRIYHVTL